MNIAAVMIVRNEADVPPTNLEYRRSIGVSDFWIIGNGPTNGTSNVLGVMAGTHSWIHWRSEPGPFHQSEFTSNLAQEAHRSGADWILPIDADEFWWAPHRSLVHALDVSGVGTFVCELQTLVQAIRVRCDRPTALMSMTYRTRPRGTEQDARQLVESEEFGFVEIPYPPKLFLRLSPSVIIEMRNHAATGCAGSAQASADFVVLHAAIRSRARLSVLAEQGGRIAAVNPDTGTSWHLKRWADVEVSGSLDSEWVANLH